VNVIGEAIDATLDFDGQFLLGGERSAPDTNIASDIGFFFRNCFPLDY
jgi:hypothetical protein